MAGALSSWAYAELHLAEFPEPKLGDLVRHPLLKYWDEVGRSWDKV